MLGIDPGSVTSGFGVIDGEGSRMSFVEAGHIGASSRLPFPERLKKMYEGIGEIISRHRPDAVAVENVFFARNVNSALKLGHARGVALLAAVNSSLPIFEYTPAEIKQSVVGYGNAEKTQVRQMVKTLLKLSSLPEPLDASDALACAICHIHSAGMKGAIRAATSKISRRP